MLVLFEAVAVTLWLMKDNLFYLFNFSYIGGSIALGIFLYLRKYKHARRVGQLNTGSKRGCLIVIYRLYKRLVFTRRKAL